MDMDEPTETRAVDFDPIDKLLGVPGPGGPCPVLLQTTTFPRALGLAQFSSTTQPTDPCRPAALGFFYLFQPFQDEPTEAAAIAFDPGDNGPTEMGTQSEIRSGNNSFGYGPLSINCQDTKGCLPSGRPSSSAGTALSGCKQQSQIHDSKSKSTRTSTQGLYGKHKRATQLESLSSRLVKPNAIEGFANNCEKIWEDWTSLLRRTTLPPNINSSDTRVIAAFRAVDSVISKKQSTCVLRWLAYVQLMALFDSLKPVVRVERENGKAHRERGNRDISAVIDIYENAQRPSDRRGLRNVIVEHRRTGKRVESLAGPSPLFLLIYSDEAEAVIRDFKRTNNRTLALVATKILQTHPTQFVRFCTRLAEEAERAIRSNRSASMEDIWNIARRKNNR